jgi:hypothetical protein
MLPTSKPDHGPMIRLLAELFQVQLHHPANE